MRLQGMKFRKSVVWGSVFVLGISVYALIQRERLEKMIMEEQEIQEMSVSELPAGTKESWLNFLDQRLPILIKRSEKMIVISDPIDEIINGRTNLSINYPYKIKCNMFGIEIQFGTELLFDTLKIVSNFEDRSKKEYQEPPLDVRISSIAGKNLLDELLAIHQF
jgi:hypothetical protein